MYTGSCSLTLFVSTPWHALGALQSKEVYFKWFVDDATATVARYKAETRPYQLWNITIKASLIPSNDPECS